MRRRMTYGCNPDPNTLLMLHFDGDLKDSSLCSNTVSGGSSNSYVDGKFGKSVIVSTNTNLNGNNNINVRSLPDMTIEWWEYNTAIPTSDDAGGAVIEYASRATSSSWNLLIGHYWNRGTGLTYSLLLMSVSSYINLGTPTINTWHHYAITKNGNNWKSYKDGVQQGGFSSSSSPSNSVISIGSRNTSIPQYLATRRIDDLRISNVVRYTSNFTPPTKPLS